MEVIIINKLKSTILKVCVIFFALDIFGVVNAIKAEAYSNIVFKNITVEDGLAQATVECMIQDSKGYMWFGTNDGLNRYDGYNFELYRNEIGVENSIVNNYIVCMSEDKEENLWVGTIDGAIKINLSTNKITNYTSSSGLSNRKITDILITEDGEILLSTIDGLNLYDKTNDKFIRIFDKEYLEDQAIYSLDEDVNGDIWLGGSRNITKINLKNNTCEDFSGLNKNHEKINDFAYKVLCDGKYTWVGTISNGLYKINIETYGMEVINTSNSSIPSNNVRTIMKDNSGILWIGTDLGLVKYNYENNEYNTYINKAYDKNSLVDDYVYSIIQDRSGLIWVGTYAGVSMFESDNKIEHYKVDPLSSTSINENLINGIYEDDDGLIWLGTNTKGINILDRKNDIIYDISNFTDNTKLSSNSIIDISGHANKIFIATSNGLNIYDKNTRKISVYNEMQGLNSKYIRSIMYDDSGVLWIGTKNGINILNLKTDEIIDLNYILDKCSVSDRYVESIFKDSEGFYWLGSFFNGGLIKIDPYTKNVTNYKHEGKEGDISNNSIRTIVEDNDKNIWIGTSGGLNKLDKKTDKFSVYTTSDGLANNTIYGIVIDNHRNLWMSTNFGISKLDIEKDRFLNLNVTDGLQSNEFNGNSYGKLKSGELIFGGINGLNIFNPDEILNDIYISKVEFDKFKVNGKKVNTLENVRLKHTENTIGINLFLPDYKNIKNIKYYYLLEGSGNDWSLISNNEIILSNLSSGTYVFRVKARSSSGVFSEESSFRFTIDPPLWKSRGFILIYILTGASVVFLILKRKNAKMRLLDDMVNKRTKELSDEMEKNTELLNKIINLEKRKNSYLVNLSHELRTPLNVLSSIHQLIDKLNKSEEGIEREKLNHYIHILGKNVKRLLNLINDLIDSSKIENGNYHINIDKHNIVYIVEDTALLLKDYVESKNVELTIDPEVEECIIECDSYEIERCIINLVNNAAKFTNEGGSILVSIVELENEVKIMVSDTGIGIEKKYLETIFDRFNQVIDSDKETKGGSGLGLTITKLIVGLHNGKIFAESEVNVGSKFTIILPKKQPKQNNKNN